MSAANTPSAPEATNDDDSVPSLPEDPALGQWHQQTPMERFLQQDEDLADRVVHRAITTKPVDRLMSYLLGLEIRTDVFISFHHPLKEMGFFSTPEQEESFRQNIKFLRSYLRATKRSLEDPNTAITEYAQSLIRRLLENLEAPLEELSKKTNTFRVEDIEINTRSFLTEEISYYILELQPVNLNATDPLGFFTDDTTQSKVSALDERNRERPKTISEREGLVGWLLNVCAHSAMDGARYLPLDALEKVLSRHVVEKELRNQGISKRLIQQYVARICDYQPSVSGTRKRPGHLLKIFAILVLIKETRSIELFIQDNVDDSNLPFTTSESGSHLPVPKKHQVLLSNSIGKNFVANFLGMQPLLLAPYFELAVHQQDITYINHYDLPSEAPLPFTIMSNEKKHRRSIAIHPGQYNRYDCARTSCKNHDIFTLFWWRDFDGYQTFGSLRLQKSIIKPLLTFDSEGIHYAVLPYIKDNLEGFLKTDHPTASAAGQWAMWIVYQSKILAAGAWAFYNTRLTYSYQQPVSSRYRHNWPEGVTQERILWLDSIELEDVERNKGCLRLFYGHDIVKPLIQAPVKYYSDRDREMEGIAKLGCLLLKLVVWCYEGRLGVEQLSHEELELRSSSSLLALDGTGMKPPFKNLYQRWIDKLQDSPNCSQLIYDFLDLIRTDMMEMKFEKTLLPAEIANRCHQMILKCEFDVSYYDRPRSDWIIGNIYPQGTDSGYGTREQELSAIASTLRSAVTLPCSIEEESLMLLDGVEDELHDTASIYSVSETRSLPPLHYNRYVEDIAMVLFETVETSGCDMETVRRISQDLPSLLKAFAQKLSYEAPTQVHRDISYFVQKNRGRIQALFDDLLPLDQDENVGENEPYSSDFSILRFLEAPSYTFEAEGNAVEPISEAARETRNTQDDELKGEDSEQEEEEQQEEDEIEEEVKQEEDTNEPRGDENQSGPRKNTGVYRDVILTTPAYKWMIGVLERETVLTRPTPNIMQEIKTSVVDALPISTRVSRRTNSQQHRAVFYINWDPIVFADEQRYEDTPDRALPKAITITGSEDDAQALTTEQYICQTWPTGGKEMLGLIMRVVALNSEHAHSSLVMEDGTGVEIRYGNGHLVAIVTGVSESLAEVAQQLGWLGAALRSSPYSSGGAKCTPEIRMTEAKSSGRIKFQLSFRMEQIITQENIPGHCWHKMFRSPVLVCGYPIKSKHEQGLGLELALNMMAALAGSDRLTEFYGRLFLKGFTALLIATKVCQDLLVWHYHQNSYGERVSYLDYPLEKAEAITFHNVEGSRHIVGWCSNCQHFAGAADAEYNVARTRLPRPHATMLLEKATISGGMFVRGGLSIGMGIRDSSPHLLRNSYIPKLQWLATRYVVLWDEDQKKGWLVNGTSALLHLARASLEHYRTDDFSEVFRFDATKMEDAAEHMPNSAIKILINERNRGLEIYPGKIERSKDSETTQKGKEVESSRAFKKKEGYFLFEDFVEQHYNTLDQMIDHQKKAGGKNGIDMKLRVRNHLEGWDFAEVATDYDPVPRVATLSALGYGWVDFV